MMFSMLFDVIFGGFSWPFYGIWRGVTIENGQVPSPNDIEWQRQMA